jgi:hypothetical protein
LSAAAAAGQVGYEVYLHKRGLIYVLERNQGLDIPDYTGHA